MDLFDAAKVCRRRWYLFLPLLLITVTLAGIAYFSAHTVYQATAVVGVSPSPITGSEGNGILNNGGTQLLANLTALALQQPHSAETITGATGATSFEAAVYVVPGGQLPLVNMVVTADDPDIAVDTLPVATDEARAALARVQGDAGIPERSFATVYQVSADATPTALVPGRSKMTVGILGVGFVFSVLATLLFDTVSDRRRRATGDEPVDNTPESTPVGPPLP